MDLRSALAAFTGLVVIINPLIIATAFVTLTQNASKAQRSKIAHTAALAAFITMAACFLLGYGLLAVFGIDIAAFRVAGGALVAAFGMSMAKGEPIASEADTDDPESIAVVPLVIPITTGPGTMVMIVVGGTGLTAWDERLVGLAVLLAVALVIWASFLTAPEGASRLGPTGVDIAGRISGLVLTSIDVGVLATKLIGLFPGLG